MKKYFLRLGLLLALIFAGTGGYLLLDSYNYIDHLLYGLGWDKVTVYEESHRLITRQDANIIEMEEKHHYKQGKLERIEELKAVCNTYKNKCSIFIKDSEGEWKHLADIEMRQTPAPVGPSL